MPVPSPVPASPAPHPAPEPPAPPARPPRNPARKSAEPPPAYIFPFPAPSPFRPPDLRRTAIPAAPARIHASAARPSSSSGGRDHKAPWDPGSAHNSSLESALGKYMRRHKSVSSGKADAGADASGSLLTKAVRTDRKRREDEGGAKGNDKARKETPISESISASSSSHSHAHSKDKDKGKARDSGVPSFSTLDRTILQELKLSLTARASQFALKGPGPGIGGAGGTRHHPYPPTEVPYPRSYARAAVDMDVWETKWCEQLSGSLTWHVFDTPPKKVLDLGCGTGAWILECARVWKVRRFPGLPVVRN